MADVTNFGQYELRSLVGRGGMGEVYEAFDREQHRLVALKLLPPALAADQGFVERFRRESFAAAQLNDPHVIPIHRYGEIDGRLYIEMRLVRGLDLAAVLERDGPLPAARAVSFISQAAAALDAAHTENLIHRDVKPSNLLVTAEDFVYLVDFGIAHIFGLGTTGHALTATGATIGTLDYMAPERFIGRTEVDARTDVYSLSCVLYECLTGARPFPVDGLPALLHAHLNTPPPRASDLRMDLPSALDDVIARGMAKVPDDRFGSTGELAREAMAAIAGLAPGNSGTMPRPRSTTTVPWAASPFAGAAGVGPSSPAYRSPADSTPTPAPPTYIPQQGGASATGGNPVPGFTGPATPPAQLRPPATPPPNGAVAGGKRRRNRMVALIAATVAVVAVAGGVLLARVILIDGTDPVAVAVTPSLAVNESSSISPSPTPSPTPSPKPTPTPTPTTTTIPPPPPPEPTPTTVTVTSVLPAPNNDTLPATGDLGLSKVIKNIGCSRKYVTFLGSSVDPSLYRAEISSFLASNPGSSYLMTESSCGSLTPRVDGNSVYAVYLGPFSTATEACDARRTPENYVKVLDGSDPDESAIEC